MRAFEPALTEDQAALCEAIASFLEKNADADDTAVWARLTQELELTGLAVPEEAGGAGASWVEVCLALEEMGRVLFSGPFFATVALAQSLLLAADGNDELVAALASGERTGTVALTPAFGGEPSSLGARHAAGRWTVDGAAAAVLDGARADVCLAVLPSEWGDAVFAVDLRGEGIAVEPLPPFDLGRPVASLTFTEAEARLIGDGPISADALDVALARAQIAHALEQVGGMQACLELTVAYAGDRRQFGRPIGSFQAIKHRCVEMLALTETGRAIAYEAAALVAASPAEPLERVTVAAAKIFCAEAYVAVAADCIQIHGAIGFTWEHAAHRFYRRAASGKNFLGSLAAQRSLLAELLLGAA